MLPPDKENQSVFRYIQSWVKNPYDASMLKKYFNSTVSAMLFEILHFENDERFADHQRVFNYIRKIHNAVFEFFKNTYSEYELPPVSFTFANFFLKKK